MQLLSRVGIELALKKGWLYVSHPEHTVIGDAIYLSLDHELEVKAKKPVIVTLPHVITLGDRYTAYIEYHPALRTGGTLNGPGFLAGNKQEPIMFRFMPDDTLSVSSLPYVAALYISKIQL